MWFGYGLSNSHYQITNWALGTKLSIDTTWGFQPHDFKGGQSYTIITPPRATAKTGQKIGFTILMFTRLAKSDQTLSQFLDVFTGKYTDRKPINFNFGTIKNCLAYELRDPEMYKQIRGGHMYAIAFERDRPAYPGMILKLLLKCLRKMMVK